MERLAAAGVGAGRRSEVRLRRAASSDGARVNELVAAAYSHYVPLIGRTPIPMLTDYVQAVDARDVWVLAEGDVIVGVLDLDPHEDHLWLENVAVLPARQGAGLGRLLLEHAEAVARERGLPEIRLLTNDRYVSNIAMYERHGYAETHRQPHLGTDLVYFAKPIELDRSSARGVP